MAFESHQRMTFDPKRCKPLGATEFWQVDDERRPDDFAARAFDEFGRRLGGTARGDQVIHDQDALARIDGILVHLDDVDTILKRIFLTNGLPRKLALFKNGQITAGETI